MQADLTPETKERLAQAISLINSILGESGQTAVIIPTRKHTRRANNEGTVFYRKDSKRWCAQVSLSGRRLTKYAKTQSECKDWIKATLAGIENGLTFQEARITLDDYAQTWLDSKAISRRPHTIDQYRKTLTRDVLPILGYMRLNSIQPRHLNQLYLAKRAEGRGARTVQIIHAVLHSLFRQAVKQGLMNRNPADLIERPRIEQTEFTILTEAQARRFLAASEDSHYGTLFYLALITGMREGELLGLRWTDLDRDSGLIYIQRQLQRIPGKGLTFLPPKTKAGRREVKLGQRTLDRLAEHKRQQELQKAAIGERWQEHGLIFPNSLGKPMSCENMCTEFKRILKANGLPDIRFHDLRHTSISFLLGMGTPINTVQRRAGHSRASITTDTYGHVIGHSQDQAAEKLEKRFTPKA